MQKITFSQNKDGSIIMKMEDVDDIEPEYNELQEAYIKLLRERATYNK